MHAGGPVKWMVVVGSFAGFLGVLLGAFGAHGLRGQLGPERMAVWETAVLYHLVHAVMLVVAGLAGYWLSTRGMVAGAGVAFTVGLVMFSGSLYLLALTGIKGLGAITPLGGLAFLGGWLLLAVGAWRAQPLA